MKWYEDISSSKIWARELQQAQELVKQLHSWLITQKEYRERIKSININLEW